VATWVWELPLLVVLLYLQAAVHRRTHQSALASLREIHRGLREARGRADFADRSKTEFLASASHEIRTPMTSVLGFTEVLLERARGERWTDDAEGMLATIKRNGGTARNHDDILDLSKIAAGRWPRRRPHARRARRRRAEPAARGGGRGVACARGA
jgi:signal transduction histidine kinase